jgi:hypothetical protein
MSETEQTTEIVTAAKPLNVQPYEDGSGDVMRSSSGFQHAWRVAQMFAASALVPDHLRGRVPDVAVVLLMAWRLNEDPLVMMQHTHIIKGKAGFAAQYVIARANRSGVFKGRIKYRESGTPGKPDYAVTAFATLAETDEEVSFTASMEMARAEGWTSNSKYQSMPQVMLRYRAATLLVRLNAPDVMLGGSTAEELVDISQAPEVERAHRPVLDPEMPSIVTRAPTRPQEAPKPAASPAPTPTTQSAPTANQDDEGPSVADLKQECAKLEADLGGLTSSVVHNVRQRCGLGDEPILNSRLKRTGIGAYLEALRAELRELETSAQSDGELV